MITRMLNSHGHLDHHLRSAYLPRAGRCINLGARHFRPAGREILRRLLDGSYDGHCRCGAGHALVLRAAAT
jgi:glyoxylase-like metal-dependent hydrolase (beta-lactamase superfamily II)